MFTDHLWECSYLPSASFIETEIFQNSVKAGLSNSLKKFNISSTIGSFISQFSTERIKYSIHQRNQVVHQYQN
ncbi:hypothetical protein NDU88_001870 [Pleurodeles waltl]|uniref:Uncharacterized protein n=1 Tax=Pleurodeles waltl TaxID=8319 RepID=A0AAV7WPY9_PLEWA|nr:hypothetical protein NDU88_001870 [Pleurodeles waltl]